MSKIGNMMGSATKLITGDNIFTAKAIATECGILGPNQDLSSGAVIEGVEFRNYTPEQRMERVEKNFIMARSSPFEKLVMVQCLKQKGHVLAVIGDGTNERCRRRPLHGNPRHRSCKRELRYCHFG